MPVWIGPAQALVDEVRQCAEIDRRSAELSARCAGEIEQIVDPLAHPLAGAPHPLQIIPPSSLSLSA
ncbi:MAG: hypothetical protein AAB403_15935 [Planctomycetota bacterium]